MSTQGGSAGLAQAARSLAIEWENTKAHWRDLKALEFEHQYLADLPGQISTAINAMDEVEVLLKKVRSDCE